jgi:hypothetical protein
MFFDTLNVLEFVFFYLSSDRDQHIHVNYQNVVESEHHNFDIAKPEDIDTSGNSFKSNYQKCKKKVLP